MLKSLIEYKKQYTEFKDIYTQEKLYSEYGVSIYPPVQQSSEFYMLLEILGDLQPNTILEIGQELGGTLFYFSKKFQTSTILGVDINHEILPEQYKLLKNIHLITGDSTKNKTLEVVKKYTPIDFIFIDGYHYYPGVYKDFSNYFKILRSGGIIALHDINWDFSESRVGVGQLWNILKKRYPEDYLEIIYNPYPSKNTWFGIGIIVKR